MEITQRPSDLLHVLEAADRVARAAQLWIRRGFPGARTDLVAGLIGGLCDGLALQDTHALLAAYAYALIEGETADALVTARSMPRRQSGARDGSDFREGRRAARELLALLEPAGFDVRPSIGIAHASRN